MKVYFGGAYNGKLQFVKENFSIEEEDIDFCGDKDIDFSKKVICGLHNFIYFKSLNGEDSLEYIKSNIDSFKEKIIITDNILEGVVPIKKTERVWREDYGRVMQYLCRESTTVSKIYFGLEKRIKVD